MPSKSTPEDFWARVQGNRSERNGCWHWMGSTNSTGYGSLSYQGKHCTAHRVAAFLTGLIDDTTAPKDRTQSGFILHQCDNRLCCNPSHMRVGTYAENQLEAYARRRRKAYKGHTHSNAKMTEAGVHLARDLYAHGVSQDAIAALLLVSQGAISRVLLGKTYVETI